MTTTDAVGGVAQRLDLLALQAAIAEARRLVILAEAGDDSSVPDATRPLSEPERAAQVRFGVLDRLTTATATAAVTPADAVWSWLLAAVAADLVNNTESVAVLLARLEALASPASTVTLPGLAEQIADAAKKITDTLLGGYRDGAGEAVNEARRQGLLDRLLPDLDSLHPTAEQVALIDAVATRVARYPAARIIPAAYDRAVVLAPAAKSAASLATQLHGALTDLSRDGMSDTARQAAHVALGAGRQSAIQKIPAVKTAYASELLDRHTCEPCGHIDGHAYAQLADAWDDYPHGGPYHACEGGLRCRGTVVCVYQVESAPSVS